MNRFQLALAAAAAVALPMSTIAQGPQSLPPTKGAQTPPSIPPQLQDGTAQASYTLGFNLGTSLRRDQVAIDPQILAEGLKDATAGSPPQLSSDVMNTVLAKVQADVKARRQALMAKSEQQNKAEGDAFLKANGARKGVVTLPSGLQYEVIKAGTGPTPKLDDTVECNYRGTLITGQEFDSSYARGKPIEFPVSGVIKGWTEALQRMPVGSHWKLYVPSELAYGDEGRAPVIAAGATLVFDIELLDIESKN